MQSLTAPGVRRDNDQRTFRQSASPNRNRKKPSACKRGREAYKSDHGNRRPYHSGAPTARIHSPHHGRVPTRRTILGDRYLKIETQDDRKGIRCLPPPVTITANSKQEAERQPSLPSQLAEKVPKTRSSLGKEPDSKKSGTLAQRMKLPKLPVTTDDHGRAMGFAAMPSARNDTRYTSSHAVKTGETTSPADTASTSNEVLKTIASVPPQTIFASSSPRNTPAKPRPREARTKKTDPPQPTLNILKSHRKRPLSEMGIHELFTLGQVISSSEWEAKKRQRLEKKRHSAVEDCNAPDDNQDGVGIGTVEVEVERGTDSDDFPKVIPQGNRNVAGPRVLDPMDVHDAIDTGPSKVREVGIGPLEMEDLTDASPSEILGTAAPAPVELLTEINDQDSSSPETLVSGKTTPQEARVKSSDIDNSRINPEQGVAQIQPVVQQPIDSTLPAHRGKKKVRSTEPDVCVRGRASEEQGTPDFNSQTRLPTITEEPSPRIEEPIPTSRPTTAGKGISEATLAILRATEANNIAHTSPYHSIDEQQEELVTVTESIYNYHVHRREWLTEDPEGEGNAEELISGPYHTLQEANEVAAREIRYPNQISTLDGIRSSAWDYSFRRDHDGMQTQVAEAVGVHIEAEVRRGKSTSFGTLQSEQWSNIRVELAPPDQRTSFPASAFKVTPRVYLVQELSWSPTPTPTPSPPLNATRSTPASPFCETITHTCCTTLDRANKKAAGEWLAAYTGAWSDFHAEGKRKDEVERGLKFDLQELREGRECFHREVVFADGAMCKIWVVECEVEGPRN